MSRKPNPGSGVAAATKVPGVVQDVPWKMQAISLAATLGFSFIGFLTIPIGALALAVLPGSTPPFIMAVAVVVPLAGVVFWWWLIPTLVVSWMWSLSFAGTLGGLCLTFAVFGLGLKVGGRAGAVLCHHVAPMLVCLPGVPGSTLGIFGPVLLWAIVYMSIRHVQKLCQSTPLGKNDKVRVLMVGDSFAPKLDGPQVFTSNMIKELVKEGHSVAVYTSIKAAEGKPKPEDFGAEVVRGAGIADVYPGHSVTLPDVVNFVRTVIKFRPHVIHLHDEGVVTVILGPVCYLLDIPVLWTHHSRVDLYAGHGPPALATIGPQAVSWMYRVLFPTCYGHLLVDDSQKKQHWFRCLRPNSDRVRFWNSGCDLEQFNPKHRCEATRKRFLGDLPSDTKIILYVGRMAVEKQTNLFPLYAQQLKDRKLKVKLVLVGKGPGFEELQDAFGAKEVTRDGYTMWESPDQSVAMTGALSGMDLWKAYASSDLFFSPTVTGTADLVFFEAQGAGIPVVGPRIAAVPAVVNEGKHGKLYAPLDMNDAGRATQEALASLSALTKNTRPHAEKDFSWKSVTLEAVDMYRATVEGTANGFRAFPRP